MNHFRQWRHPARLLLFLLLSAGGLVCWRGVATAGGGQAVVEVITIDNQIISPVIQKYIEGGVNRAEADGAACLVITLDTPGGLLESTRAIVKEIMNAKVPIVVYVAPAGSRAASAGLFITLAANVAAMAPSTNIGAAHPIDIGGGEDAFKKAYKQINPVEETKSEKTKETTSATTTTTPRNEDASGGQGSIMGDKIMNDTVAWVRAIARTRGRNEEWAVKAVTQSLSITGEEAAQQRVVDFVAANLPDLLAKLDGRTVQVQGKDMVLRTAAAEVVDVPMNAFQRLLAAITHPNIAYLLMMLGTLGLIIEFTHPGVVFPGVAGFVCVLLSLYSLQVLPVNYVSILLTLVGLALLVAEAYVVTHGLFALGGAICMTLGSIMLFDSPDPALRVSLSVILPTVATVAAIVLLLLYRVVKSRAIPVATGAQGLVGSIAEAATELNLEGQVFVHGEHWGARSSAPVRRGEKVRIVRVEGLSLEVEPVPPRKAADSK